MIEQRNIAVDVYPLTVELSVEDFLYLIEAALDHQDDFFISLGESLDEIRKRQDEESAKC